LSDYVRQFSNFSQFNTSESWVVLSSIEKQIKEKIEKIGTPLKDWNIRINYGIKTGFNDAFIITGEKRNELIEQDPKSAEIIRPYKHSFLNYIEYHLCQYVFLILD
jgi:hypothetical protein